MFNYSINKDAIITKTDGTDSPAMDILCANKDNIVNIINSLQAVFVNGIVKWIISMIGQATKKELDDYCPHPVPGTVSVPDLTAAG